VVAASDTATGKDWKKLAAARIGDFRDIENLYFTTNGSTKTA